MKRFLPIVIILLSAGIISAQSNLRSGSTSNPEIENLGGFKPDITTFTPDNGEVGASINGTENTEGFTIEDDKTTIQNKESTKYNTSGLENIALNIYPNPATDYIIVELGEKFTGNITLINLVGNTIISTEINSLNVRIDLSELPEGIYFLNIESNNDRIVKKIKVQK